MNKVKEKKPEAPAAEAKVRKPSGVAHSISRGLVNVLNGSFLTREKVLGNMPFILFIAGLMLCYIGYGYWTERTVRELDRTSRELKDMRSEYVTVLSTLEKAEQQSHVAADIHATGVVETLEPPMRLVVKKDQLEQPPTSE